MPRPRTLTESLARCRNELHCQMRRAEIAEQKFGDAKLLLEKERRRYDGTTMFPGHPLLEWLEAVDALLRENGGNK